MYKKICIICSVFFLTSIVYADGGRTLTSTERSELTEILDLPVIQEVYKSFENIDLFDAPIIKNGHKVTVTNRKIKEKQTCLLAACGLYYMLLKTSDKDLFIGVIVLGENNDYYFYIPRIIFKRYIDGKGKLSDVLDKIKVI